MSDIFLSYSSQDRSRVQEFVGLIRSAGGDVYYDTASIPAGADFQNEIVRSIESAKYFLLFLSKAATQSKWVETETQLALEKDKKILPIFLENISDFSNSPIVLRVSRLNGLRIPTDQPIRPGSEVADRLLEFCELAGNQTEVRDAADEVKAIEREFDIFISYRRSDSSYATGHIFDCFERDYPAIKVFKDNSCIRYGKNFEVEIDGAVRSCSLVLAVIGPQWLSCKKGYRKRLFLPGDHLRIELETAFKRRVPVVPILIGETKMPKASQLPKSIRELPTSHGLGIRPHPDLHTDLKKLIDGLDHELEVKTSRITS